MVTSMCKTKFYREITREVAQAFLDAGTRTLCVPRLTPQEHAVIEAAGRCVHGEDTGGGVNYETGESEPGEMLPPFHPDLCRNLEEKWRAHHAFCEIIAAMDALEEVEPAKTLGQLAYEANRRHFFPEGDWPRWETLAPDERYAWQAAAEAVAAALVLDQACAKQCYLTANRVPV